MAAICLSSSLALADEVVVCLGDSITDGNTYPQLIMQALHEAGRPVPPLVCSGVGAHTAAHMLARLDDTVLSYQPTLVTLNVGANDAMQKVAVADYEKSVREIVRRVTASGVRMILSTPCEIVRQDGTSEQEKQAFTQRVQAALDGYEQVIRRVAGELGCVVAENRAVMRQAIARGETIFVPDGIHPNYAGQQCLARAFLDAMGHRDVPLPQVFKPREFPGIFRQWRFRPLETGADGKPLRLAPQNVAAFTPDQTWKTYTLPDPLDESPQPDYWLNQCRANGFAMDIERQLGKGTLVGCTTWHEDAPRQAWLQVGIGVLTVWHNGQRVYHGGEAWTGFHAGKQRVPINLQSGEQQLLVETVGANFFLALTPHKIWERDLYAAPAPAAKDSRP